jgi:pyruvate carboxylase
MYPQVFIEYASHRRNHGPVQVLPTDLFFYGMAAGQEVAVEIDPGKTLIIRYLATGEPDEDGKRTIFYELNGQPRTVKVQDKALAKTGPTRRKADESQPGQIGAPMPGMIVSVSAEPGQTMERGDRLFTIEAMKMETAVYADIDGEVEEVISPAGTRVDTHDLVLVLAPADA